jgi:DNA replication protein DnaC
MTHINKTMNALLSQRPMREDEYQEADGLYYCVRCRTPRQTRITILGEPLTPAVMCRCQREREEREQAEQNQKDLLQRVRWLKANGLQDKALRDYTFANDMGCNRSMAKAHRYVEQWAEIEKNSTGLLLWGGVGTGKSFFAGCVANALIDQGVPVLMTNFARILNTLTGMYSQDRNDFVDSLNQYRLLILDDLGVERNSEFALEQVFHVIDSRYRSKKPMIVTTNLTLDEMKHPADLAHARIYDRVLERCVPLKINNRNLREENAAANLNQMRERLSSKQEIQGR